MIKLASPDIQEEDIQRVAEVLRSGNLVQGACVADLEMKLAAFCGLKNCAVVSSGTAALHAVCNALGLAPGDGVIVPAFTFPATANAVVNAGGAVYFCDVDQTGYVMTPAGLVQALEANADHNIKAVIVVHEFGAPVAMKSIREIADRYELRLIEDAACALGTVADGQHVGYYGDAACFSFHPRKAITTGEGGAVLSRDQALIDAVKIFRNHGITTNRQGLDFVVAGLNYRMTEFQAVLGIGQLDRFADEIQRRRELAGLYRDLLAATRGLALPAFTPGHSWQSFMVVLDERIDRPGLIRALAAKGIETNLGAQALPELTFYKKRGGDPRQDFKTATSLYRHGLVLPLYGKLRKTEIAYIAQTLTELLHDF